MKGDTVTKDILLIRKIKNGDKEAFEQLIKEYYENIYAFCYRRTCNENTAADLTQEVFLKLISSIYNYKFTGKFSNYIFTIAVNTCNDYFKKMKADTNDKLDEIPSSDALPEETVITSEESKLLVHSLNNLPDKQREAIILHYFHDLKAKDIAKITGVPLPTAKSRIKQGLDKLRKLYKEDE